MIDRADISYRQLQMWTEKGWLVCEHRGGSGRRRVWSHAEAQVAVDMGVFVRAGVEPSTAAHLARQLQATSSVDIGGAFTLARKGSS